jgi:uncharacterized protein
VIAGADPDAVPAPVPAPALVPVPVPVRRYLPDRPFPPYAFVPRRTPHPTQHPDGHSRLRAPPPPDPLDPADWPACRTWLHGVDLFNHGYYWEAHEAWEALWHQCGRTGLTADLLRALIRLAAAGVKAREPSPRGLARHPAATGELLRQVAERLGAGCDRHLGLEIAALRESVAQAQAPGAVLDVPADAQAAPVFRFALEPR